jgi:hypothetical protein
MPLPIAAIASNTEIAPTARAAPSEAGKFSRVTPMKVRTSAQTASMMPQTWKAFTAAKATGSRGAVHRLVSGDRGRSPVSLVWGRGIRPGEDLRRLRGEALVHRRCAPMSGADAGQGAERLGCARSR